MTNDSANLPDGGSKTVEPSTDLNNPENLNFLDSDDEEQNNQEASEAGIESETDEASEDGQESDDTEEQEAETEDDGEEKPEDEEEAEKVLVTLKGGEQVPLEELKLGYMRDRDYRHKTQETANKAKSLDEMTARVTNTVNAFADYLAKQLPDEPSPSLAIQNPNEYTRQKAMYEAALSQVNKIIEMANEPKEVANKLTSQQQTEVAQAEFAKLSEAFPQVRSDEGSRKFFDSAFSVGRELGYTNEEMKDITDHRMFKLAHYARLGLQAEQAKGRALTKVANAPAAVAKVKAKGQAATQARSNQEAMKKLSRTGSIKDAMSIDFD